LLIVSCDYGDHRFEDTSTLIEQIAEHLQAAKLFSAFTKPN
jgi:hypothetical protein